jgi:hypothetical protein
MMYYFCVRLHGHTQILVLIVAAKKYLHLEDSNSQFAIEKIQFQLARLLHATGN